MPLGAAGMAGAMTVRGAAAAVAEQAAASTAAAKPMGNSWPGSATASASNGTRVAGRKRPNIGLAQPESGHTQ